MRGSSIRVQCFLLGWLRRKSDMGVKAGMFSFGKLEGTRRRRHPLIQLQGEMVGGLGERAAS